MAEQDAPWGRVDETGTVYVRTSEGEREVGQYLDGTPEEALAFYERKYEELASQITLIEQRVRAGAPARDLSKALAAFRTAAQDAAAVGDLAALDARAEAITTQLGALESEQKQERQVLIESARAAREAIVAEAEALAAKDLSNVQWKSINAQLDELFARWQKSQQDSPRLPKTEADALWKRFRTARSTVENARRAFYSQLEGNQKQVRAKKRDLITRAEALAPRGSDGIDTYRGLLVEWKLAGRAGKKYDDALWEQFKAAGDALYAAKAEIDAVESVEFTANLEQKSALLDEAEAILKLDDIDQARTALRGIQTRWDLIGKVPRDQVRTVEDRLRKVENHVRKLGEEHWSKNNPETKARAAGLAGQLEEAIEKLEAELAEAKAAKNTAKVKELEEALGARKTWLAAIR